MSKHTWNVDAESDAQRLVTANLPSQFVEALAGIAGEHPNGASGEFEIEGDIITFKRSYITVARDGAQIASLPMKTLIRANALLRAKVQEATKTKKQPAIIEWE